jgi:hypothetical protein
MQVRHVLSICWLFAASKPMVACTASCFLSWFDSRVDLRKLDIVAEHSATRETFALVACLTVSTGCR